MRLLGDSAENGADPGAEVAVIRYASRGPDRARKWWLVLLVAGLTLTALGVMWLSGLGAGWIAPVEASAFNLGPREPGGSFRIR